MRETNKSGESLEHVHIGMCLLWDQGRVREEGDV